MATGALVNELFSNCTPETLSKKISECFREFDRDNSGGLDSEEIGRAFLLVGKPLKDEDILTWLKEFDADGNGIIDEDEFAHMVRNRMGHPCEFTCIPCLRGCSTTQCRPVAKPPKAVPRSLPPIKVSHPNDEAHPDWAGGQKLPSMAERKALMMNNIFRNDAQAAASVNTSMNLSKGEGQINGGDKREEGTGGGGAMFTRTSSAPAAMDTKSDKEEIDEIFKLVKRKSIACRVDRQWEDRSLDNSLRAATGLLDQLNMFLVAHLKSVPEEKLPTKIKETFQLIDIDGSGELNMQEVGQAFERLGKPLSKADLETYMKNVDVDGNGSVDVDEFEHMTRKLLSIACRLPCRTCRLLYQRQEEDNWRSNKEHAIAKMEEEETEARVVDASGGGIDVFGRSCSSPATLESQKAEQEVLSRQAAARKHNHIPNKSGPSSKQAKGKSSKATLATGLASSVDGPENQPFAQKSPAGPKETRKSPSRVTSKLHDALASASTDQGASAAEPRA